jgi:hypothetical protein
MDATSVVVPPFLRSSSRNIACLLIFASVVAIYAFGVIRTYVAQEAAQSNEVNDLQRAARLIPQNAQFAHALGLQLSNSPQDYDRAITNLRRAATLDPDNGDYWLDLASVYQLAGEPLDRNSSLEAAVSAEPNNPDITAEVANYYLVGGETARALPLLRRALEKDPSAAASLLPAFWRATRDPRLLLDEAIPPNPELQIAFLRLLVEQNESSGAAETWRHLLASGQAFQPQLCLFYFDYLIREHDVTALAQDWSDLARVVPSLQAYLPSDNLIVNGSFEQPLLYAGLDWRYDTAEHVSAGIDNQTAHSGTHSLHVSYDGGAAYEAGWQEFVPVQPGEYEFSAWIKSQDILSSSGPRFSITDKYTGAGIFLSDDILDTHTWQKVEGRLRVPAATNLLSIKISRAPANTRIRGEVWIDDLRLERR